MLSQAYYHLSDDRGLQQDVDNLFTTGQVGCELNLTHHRALRRRGLTRHAGLPIRDARARNQSLVDSDDPAAVGLLSVLWLSFAMLRILSSGSLSVSCAFGLVLMLSLYRAEYCAGHALHTGGVGVYPRDDRCAEVDRLDPSDAGRLARVVTDARVVHVDEDAVVGRRLCSEHRVEFVFFGSKVRDVARCDWNGGDAPGAAVREDRRVADDVHVRPR